MLLVSICHYVRLTAVLISPTGNEKGWRMFLEKLFTKTTRKAPSAPVREPFIAPTLLPACCACGLVQDKAGATHDLDRWISQRTYRETHGVNPTELALTHTYCPKCFTKAQDTVRQYFREIGTSP